MKINSLGLVENPEANHGDTETQRKIMKLRDSVSPWFKFLELPVWSIFILRGETLS